MAPASARAATGLATLVVLAGVVYAAAVGERGAAAACLACALGVGIGWVVVHHEPSSAVGPALAWSTAAIALVTAHGVGPLRELPWSSGMWPVNLAGLLALLLVFPAGPLRTARWRLVPCVLALATAGTVSVQWGARQVAGRVVGGPDGSWVPATAVASLAAVGAALVAGVASLVVRYRRGGQRTRQQVRWLLVAGIVVVALLAGGWVAEIVGGASLELAYTPFIVATVALVPAAVGLAVVRHDLFDVDRLLGATTAWLVTVLAAAGVFAVVVQGLSRAVSLSTGVGSTVAAFVTALAILPVQQHLAAGVGRFVDRDRYVAIAAVERFAADVRAGRRQPEEVDDVLREVQDDPALVLHLARPDGGWVRVDGTETPDADGLPVTAGDEVIARVRLGLDSARARRRLGDLTRALWMPIEVSRLRLELRAAVADAEAARGRLAEAAAQERRRLERDLHDGAQQRILATGMRLRLLQERLPPDHGAEVDVAVRELRDAVEELRRIAQGVRPSRLDDGLAAALVAVRQTTPLPVELEVGDLPEVSELRALTAYLVVSEAVANALKHAQASCVRVRVGALDDRLTVAVVDDGLGGIAADALLPALRDRVVSVGGTLHVESADGVGTTIRAVL